MPKKVGSATKAMLIQAPLPSKTSTYTVISHSYIIDTIVTEFTNAGFKMIAEDYKCSSDAKVATGTFIMEYGSDPELQLTYSFTNSYDKTQKFRAAIGAHIIVNDSYMIGDTQQWNRKHTGTADSEATELIKTHILEADKYFNELKQAKDQMKYILITKSEFGALLGEMFINGWYTIDQLSLAAREYDIPSYIYPLPKENLWTCYSIIVNSMKSMHPSKWLQCQISMHLFFAAKYNLITFDESDVAISTVVIDGVVHPAIPGLLEQVPVEEIILPGFGTPPPVVQPIATAPHVVEDPNQLTIHQVIEEIENVLDTDLDFEVVDTKEELVSESVSNSVDELPEVALPEPPAQLLTNTTVKEEILEEVLPVKTVIEAPVIEEPIVNQVQPEVTLPSNENIPVDIEVNSIESTEEESVLEYFQTSDLEGLSIGDVFETNDVFYTIKRIIDIASVPHFECELTVFKSESEVTEEAIVQEIETAISIETQLPEMEISVPIAEEIQEPILEPSVETTEISLETSDSLPETPEQKKIREAIAAEILDIYGTPYAFEWEDLPLQYSVKIENQLPVMLSKQYMASKLI